MTLKEINNEKPNIREVFTKVFIAITFFLFISCSNIVGQSTVNGQYILNRCQLEFNVSQTIETSCDQNETDEGILQAQSKASHINLVSSLCSGLPSALMLIIYGSYGDIIGRKYLLIIAWIGCTLTAILQSIFIFFDLPYWTYFLSLFPSALCGGMMHLVSNCFACYVDISAMRNRRLVLALGAGIVATAYLIISIVLGFAIQTFSFGPPHYALSLLMLLSGGFIFLIPETNAIFINPQKIDVNCLDEDHCSDSEAEAEEEDNEENYNGSDKQMMIVSYKSRSPLVMFKKTLQVFSSNTRRGILMGLLLVVFLTYMFCMMCLMGPKLIYLLGPPFCWTSREWGMYQGLSVGFAQLFTFLGLRFIHNELALLLLGQTSFMLVFILVGVSSLLPSPANSWVVFSTIVVGGLGSISMPVIRASLSKMVTSNEIGSLFGFVACVESFSITLGGLVSNAVFQLAISFFAGFVFFLHGFFIFLTLIVIILYHQLKIRWTPRPVRKMVSLE